MKNTLIKIFYVLKAPLLSFLEKELIKIAIANLVKSGIFIDFRIWLIKFIAEKLFEEVARPVVSMFFRKVGYIYEVQSGKHLLKRIENSNSVDDWDHHTNSV